MFYKSVSIVITNYNGEKILEKFLPSVVDAAKFYEGQTEIIVVDDAGTDGSVEFIRNNLPEVKIIRLEENIGPLLATNVGIRASKNQIIILLDNDVLVKRDFISPLVKHFEDANVFGVGPSLDLLNPEFKQFGSKICASGLVLRRGFLEAPFSNLREAQEQNFIFLLGGGASAMEREKLLKLGGFDELFSPFYWEDADLSYRAWKRGWKILFEPKSMVHHQAHSTISSAFSDHYVEKISERNRYILIWKNISDSRILFCHVLWIPVRFLGSALTGKWWRVSSLFLALSNFKKIRQKRKIELQEAKKSDAEVFDFFSKIMKSSSRF